MGRVGSGVEVRPTSIRLSFVYQGRTCRETLRIKGEVAAPTVTNIRYAERLAREIRDRIKFGSFVYADYFPASGTSGRGQSFGDWLDTWLDAAPKNWAHSQLLDVKPEAIASLEFRFADGSTVTAKRNADATATVRATLASRSIDRVERLFLATTSL